MPKTDPGVAAMLVKFDTNANANSGALATKYVITTAELNRIRQARYVWQWFIDTLGVARDWPQSITAKRDGMFSLPAAPAVPTGSWRVVTPIHPGPTNFSSVSL